MCLSVLICEQKFGDFIRFCDAYFQVDATGKYIFAKLTFSEFEN